MAVVVATSLALHLLPILILVATNEAAVFSITNNCSFIVWPAAVPVGGGVQLNPGQTQALNVPAGTSSRRLWGRTGCSFNSSDRGACQTGDCGGRLSCSTNGQPPTTLAEFTIGGASDFFDISIIDGFNLPVAFLSACGTVLCCVGNTTSQCPDAYVGPDDQKTHACPGNTNYELVFCPPSDLELMPTTVSPQPATAFQITPTSPTPMPVPPGATRTKSSSRSRIAVILGPVGGFIFLIMLFIVIFFVCKRRTRHHEMEEVEKFLELQGMPTRFTFQELKVATEDFRDQIGEGGFGTVFKGQFGEEIIAVKCLDRSGQGKREFLAEVQTIGGIHRINLVRLIGFCAEKSHRLLVYEFMPKGSLDKWIYYRQGNDALPLDWKT
uniref:Protein kinase domain-containing protein n=1 Tax=Arundo donax TaxID=35708 RepID=A0A0A9BYJ7_ARUDO